MWVSYVACSKYARNTCTRSIAFSNDITGFIGFHPRLENIRIRFVTDGQEESVNSHIVAFFVGFTHTFHYVHAFHTVIAKQTYSIVFKQYGNVRMIQYTLLHDFRSTKERLTYHKIYLAGQSCQIHSFFAGSIATTYYSYVLRLHDRSLIIVLVCLHKVDSCKVLVSRVNAYKTFALDTHESWKTCA